MNIFILSENPITAAQMQCDKHVVKMVTESAQMMSTVHRVLDGTEGIRVSKNGRKLKYWDHPKLDDVLYKSVHVNHPSTVWTGKTSENYKWHYWHWCALADEYEFRYGRVHEAYNKLKDYLSIIPKNIPYGFRTEFPLAMKNYPECVVEGDPVQSYHNFYHADKASFAKWERGREAPEWWKND